MKQHITLQQWDELSKEQKQVIWDSGFQNDWKMAIGNMLEFLGDDWLYMVVERGNTPSRDDELCDFLWKYVKIKLTKK